MSAPRGWWSVKADDAERLTPALVKEMADQLDDAYAAGKQVIVVTGITLTYHDATGLDVDRLAMAEHTKMPPSRCQAFGARDHDWTDHRASAREVAARYAALGLVSA